MIAENIKKLTDKGELVDNAVHSDALSPEARKYLDSLGDKRARNVRKHLKELEKDPFRPRATCDIDIVACICRPTYVPAKNGRIQSHVLCGSAGGVCYGSLPEKERSGLYGKLIDALVYELYGLTKIVEESR